MRDIPENHDDLEDLIAGHFDGSLSEQQEKGLAVELTESTSAKQLFLSYMRMEGRLHSLVRDGFVREPAAAAQDNLHSDAEVTLAAQHSNQQFAFTRSRLWSASSALVVSAAVILMLSFGVLRPTSVSASSVLQKAKLAAAELVDRAYRVTLSRAGVPSSLLELRVDVRGGGRFVLRPVDGAFVMGSDGTDYWLTQQDGPVWVTSGRGRLLPKLKRTIPNTWLFGIATNPKEPLLLEMADLLSLAERTHDVELIDSAGASEHHVRANLRSGLRNAPERIDFWADADSGVALRAEIRWADGRQMRFELVESATFTDQWYHYSQHAPGRQVKRLKTTK
jgi:hypothetical protein